MDAHTPNPSVPPRGPRKLTGFGFRTSFLKTGPQSFIGHDQFNQHVLFKINDKADGLNSMLQVENSPSKLLITKVPTLIIGMDVCYDRLPSDYDSPSIAVVVHSRLWPQISEYRAYAQTQSPNAESVDYLFKPVPECDGKMRDIGIMSELLQDFYSSSGDRKPGQIIIFRYGDCESQLTQVLNAEVDQIVKACKCFDENWSPRFVVIEFFNRAAPWKVSPRFTKGDKLFDDFRVHLRKKAGMIDTAMPLQYRDVLDQVDLSADDLEELVNSLSYVHQLRTSAVLKVAPYWFGLKKTMLEEPGPKRMKRMAGPDEVNLRRDRDLFNDGEELAVYALGNLNAKSGVKYKFDRYLNHAQGYYGYDSSSMKWWQHVSMYAEEANGDNVSHKKIIFAELCFWDGKYESIRECVLDPKEPAGIRYGCGFCCPSYAGPHLSPHPADRSKFVAGHWGYNPTSFVGRGLLPRCKSNPHVCGSLSGL